MKARERVRATLAGAAVDRPPLCLWHHFRPQGSPAALADATLAFFGGLDFDLFKIMPDLPYPAPPDGTIRAPEGWLALPRLGVEAGEPLGGMAEAVALVRRARPEAVVLATVFSPLALALRFSAGAEGLSRLAGRDASALHHGLGILADNVGAACAACLRAGADGIYFATAGLGDGMLEADAYQAFGRPYDLRALRRCEGGWCNVVHLHGASALHWRWAADYPVPVVSWSDRRTGVPLAEVAHALPGRTVMGGLDETGALVRGDQAALAAEMHDAVRQTGGRRLILAGGCSVPDDTPDAHLRMARALVDEAWAP